MLSFTMSFQWGEWNKLLPDLVLSDGNYGLCILKSNVPHYLLSGRVPRPQTEYMVSGSCQSSPVYPKCIQYALPPKHYTGLGNDMGTQSMRHDEHLASDHSNLAPKAAFLHRSACASLYSRDLMDACL